jgi:hypothetical protein
LREYRFQATDSTVEALRRLRSGWSHFVQGEMQCTIMLVDGDSIVIEVDTVDVEGVFDAYRMSARRVPSGETVAPETHGILNHATNGNGTGHSLSGYAHGAFARGANDVVLFSGASWSEPVGSVHANGLSESALLLFSGHVGQVTETAEIVCITTDAFVVASPTGVGLLFRTGLKPESVEVVKDADKVREFLLQRGYGQQDEA